MAEELRCIVVSGRQQAATLKLSNAAVENPVFLLSGDDDDGGGTIGTNIIGPRFSAYLAQLEPEDPITFELAQVTDVDMVDAEQLAAAQDRQVVLLEVGP